MNADMQAVWSVWVGGGEVNGVYLTRADADTLASRYRADGYDDVEVTQERTADVECSQCGRVGPESVACWNMADPVCPECWCAS